MSIPSGSLASTVKRFAFGVCRQFSAWRRVDGWGEAIKAVRLRKNLPEVQNFREEVSCDVYGITLVPVNAEGASWSGIVVDFGQKYLRRRRPNNYLAGHT